MSPVLEQLRRAASRRPQRLLFAEGEDDRIVRAAAELRRAGVAETAIVGSPETVRAVASRAKLSAAAVPVLDAADRQAVERTRAALLAARGDRMPAAEIERASADPLFQAAACVRDGLADCLVAGAVRATADVVRAALWLVGLAPGVRTLSSFFLMALPPGAPGGERVLVFADCAVVPDPDPGQLAEIACLAADHYQRLTSDAPRTAFLSFSTRGSADHPRVRKVREALALARARRPDLDMDGELQADAALDLEVARRKAPGSAVAGRANVLVFPDLDAGNIGYKLVARLAGARAWGPILMGLARQVNDLSRGSSAEEVAAVSTIACAISAAREPASSA